MSAWSARLISLAMRFAHRARTLALRITNATTHGVHGVVLTPAGEVVLVRLTYADGWYVPGGGRRRTEGAEEGLLRELREEIGLQRWGSIEKLSEGERVVGRRREHNALFLVRDAHYRPPRRSLEIAEVRAFKPGGMPERLAPWTRGVLHRAGLAVPPATSGR